MITSRLLFRFYDVSKIASSCVLSIPVHYHGLSNNWKMSGKNDSKGAVEQNRQKKVKLVWRSISAQASSCEDVTENSENDSQVQEVRGSMACQTSIREMDVVQTDSATVLIDSFASTSTNIGSGAENESISTEKHSVSVEVGSSLMRFIKGKGGSTQKKIEEEMGVKILFPSSKKEDIIVIEGNSGDVVSRASKKIEALIDEVVQSRSLDYSHFISLPLAIHPDLVDKLFSFQNGILGNTNSDACADVKIGSESSEDISDGEENDQLQQGQGVEVKLKGEEGNEKIKVDLTSIPIVSYQPKASKSSALTDLECAEKKNIALGIDRSIFIKPRTFHLTVLMLKLWNKERVAAASKVLQSISSKVMEVLDNRPVFIRLKGLDCMRGSLAKARVVYAPVEELDTEGRLLRACQIIIDAYSEAGLVVEKDSKQKLKLHATIMNARHRRSKRGTRKMDSFDARSIFKQYGSEEWGDYIIREAHLSQRFVFGENGYYHCCASIPFPENMELDLPTSNDP